MKAVPPTAKRIPADKVASGLISLTDGHLAAWTEVQGKATPGTQTEDGMGKGQPYFRIDFNCPRCEEAHYFHSTSEHAPPHLIPDPKGSDTMVPSGFSGHVVRCHCDATLIARVVW